MLATSRLDEVAPTVDELVDETATSQFPKNLY